MKVLSIVPFSPRRDATHGGAKAIASLLVELAERHPLALVHLRGSDELPADPELVALCELVEEITVEQDTRALARRLRKLLGLVQGRPLWSIDVDAAALAPTVEAVVARWRPDIVQVEYSVLMDSVSRVPRSIPVVLVNHEPGTARAVSELRTADAGLRTLLRQRLDLLAWRRFDRRIVRRASAVVVFSQRDRATIANDASQTPLHVIPLGLDASAPPLDATGTDDTIVFVGSFVHPPNVDAALLLIREILPAVRARHPNVIAYIVGDRPPAELVVLAAPNVVVTGRVERVEPYLDRSAVVVAPLRQGGGMRVKVLEALAGGKALVATPLAVAGLDVTDGRHVVLAEAPMKFADAISDLLSDPKARRDLGGQARAWALEHPGWDSVATRYEHIYEAILGSRATS